MNNSPKYIAYNLLLQYKILKKPSLETLISIIESKGFSVILFRKEKNTDKVNELISKLHIEDSISGHNCFTYINNSLKFVFINETLSQKEKICLLCHEIGHIFDNNINTKSEYTKIMQEEFANEFSHYFQHPGLITRLRILLKMKRFAVISFLLILVLAVSGYRYYIGEAQNKIVTTVKINSVEKYYVTTGGKKYHHGFCPSVKYKTNLIEYTLDEVIEKGYTPCRSCIGESETVN